MLQPRPVGNLKIWRLQAFTLVEVMTVIAIIAILITLALPGTGSLTASANSDVYASALVNALNEAQQTAIQKNVYVTLCPVNAVTVTTNANIVIPACVSTTTWNSWVVYIDNAINPSSAQELLSLGGNMVANSITASRTGYLVFSSSGLITLNGTTTPISPISFIIAAPGCRGSNGREITINPNGTIVVANVSC